MGLGNLTKTIIKTVWNGGVFNNIGILRATLIHCNLTKFAQTNILMKAVATDPHLSSV